MASLDYNKCTPTELRTFIRNRSSLTSSNSAELEDFLKPHLVARLGMLDKHSRFRFLDLPPEIRLEVYRHILVARDCSEPFEAADQIIETSLLRTCKLIYKEAEQVLYGENEFAANITFPSRGSFRTCSSSYVPYRKSWHYFEISRAGRPKATYKSRYGIRTTHMASCSCFDVLRRIRHLTLYLHSDPYGAPKVLPALCTMLSGASKLDKLTIVLDDYWLPGLDMKQLAADFWSVALLRDDVELEFKAKIPDVQAELAEGYETLHTSLEKYRDLLRTDFYQDLQATGDLISKARKVGTRRPKDGCDGWGYSTHIEAMLDELVRGLGMPKRVEAFHIPVKEWRTLQTYVNTLDQSLGPIRKA